MIEFLACGRLPQLRHASFRLYVFTLAGFGWNQALRRTRLGYVKSIGGDPRRLRVSCLRSD